MNILPFSFEYFLFLLQNLFFTVLLTILINDYQAIHLFRLVPAGSRVLKCWSDNERELSRLKMTLVWTK